MHLEKHSDRSRILVFRPSVRGGNAQYAAEQAKELDRRGYRVLVLAAVGAKFAADWGLDVRRLLAGVPETLKSKLLRRLLLLGSILLNQMILVVAIAVFRPRIVLFEAYSELLAPVWVWPHLAFSKLLRVRYAVTVHDPERVNRFGPDWWHRLSVRSAYAPFSVGLVHGVNLAQRARIPDHLKLADVPHGTFVVSNAAASDPGEVRRRFGIPSEAPVALAFGYVADRKNLDLAIRTLREIPELHLLVAGSRAASTDRPISYYVELARQMGVSERVHFADEYISDDRIGEFFTAATLLLLTYKKEFVSQSGILHLACNWDKPVVASSGPGPLIDTVANYGLGVCVAPDSTEALALGLRRVLIGDYPELGWDAFRKNASWATNVDSLLDALGELDLANGE